MPNWTSNRIRVRGEPLRLRAFLNAISTDETSFDFNRLIPMPEFLRHTNVGFTNGEVASNYIIRRDDDGDPIETRPFTAEEEILVRDIGHSNWYDWSIANWGTKWNAACASVTADGFLNPDEIEITFDTAWSAPVPIFRRMIDAFPELHFECHWVQEDEPDMERILRSLPPDDEGGDE